MIIITKNINKVKKNLKKVIFKYNFIVIFYKFSFYYSGEMDWNSQKPLLRWSLKRLCSMYNFR
jgi:hypothetical protein